MHDPIFLITLSGAGLVALGIMAFAGLSGWRGWLELQRMALDRRQDRSAADWGGQATAASSPAARIEIADLKERVRKLEAIAAGVDI